MGESQTLTGGQGAGQTLPCSKWAAASQLPGLGCYGGMWARSCQTKFSRSQKFKFCCKSTWFLNTGHELRVFKKHGAVQTNTAAGRVQSKGGQLPDSDLGFHVVEDWIFIETAAVDLFV